MTKEYGTIKIPRMAYEKHNERRKAMNLSWAGYIDAESPDERPDLEEVLGRIDDLEANLPRKVAEELR